MDNTISPSIRRPIITLVIFLSLVGVGLRFYHITSNDFVFYDEGLYLNHSRNLLELIEQHFPQNISDCRKVVNLWFKSSLSMTKVLWVMVSDIRVFWGGLSDWFFPRVISACAGCLTLLLTFRFAKKYFSSNEIGTLSLLFLALLPSHVFYSRLALQEALCTLFFLGGFYLYLFPRTFGLRTFLSALCFACAFMTNYRVIFIPLFVLLTETFVCATSRATWNLRKYLWNTLTFLLIIVLVGNLEGGRNSRVVFGWMFVQAHSASETFSAFNLLSYPYYIFRLENPLLGLLFFGNITYFACREYKKLLPFLLVCLQMLIFSLAEEKGARYLCIVTPFMAIACASLAVDLFQKYQSKILRLSLGLFVMLTLLMLCHKSIALARSHSDYESSIRYIRQLDPQAKILSTQPKIQNLYTSKSDVEGVPKKFPFFLHFYAQGFQYLVIDPQVYVSWADGDMRFNTKLIGYMNFIVRQVKPLRVFPHFSKDLLERFVFEHSTNLRRSIRFLNARDYPYGTLSVYSIRDCIDTVNERIGFHRSQEK
ncbi:MAG: hypothetical protein ABIJ41_00140 [Candidatus Omnitrophota bacterium]